MPKVCITDRIQNPDIERTILGDNVSTELDCDAEVLLVWRQRVDQDFMDRFPNLRAIIRYGVGYERIDLEYASRKGILVCNNPDYCLDEVSDSAIAMIMNIARGIFRFDHLARHFKTGWQENNVPAPIRISESTLGIIGAGNIGSRVLKKANGIGFKTVYFDPYLNGEKIKTLSQMGAMQIPVLQDFLKVVDIVSLHVPLTFETRHMVNHSFLSGMKRGASLVNTARGELFESLDLIMEFLCTEHLASVMLDVLPEEPPRSNRLFDAWRSRDPQVAGRLIINSHKAYLSSASVLEMRQKAAKNALKIVEGEKPDWIVN